MSTSGNSDQDGSHADALAFAVTEIGPDSGGSVVKVVIADRLSSDTDTPSQIVPAAGVKFGRYELLSMLGSGGFGEVWKCWDSSLNRHVALKFAKAGVSADHQGFSLRDEAQSFKAVSPWNCSHLRCRGSGFPVCNCL